MQRKTFFTGCILNFPSSKLAKSMVDVSARELLLLHVLLKARPCPFIQILSWFYQDFIQILSRFHLDIILILSRLFKNSLYPWEEKSFWDFEGPIQIINLGISWKPISLSLQKKSQLGQNITLHIPIIIPSKVSFWQIVMGLPFLVLGWYEW